MNKKIKTTLRTTSTHTHQTHNMGSEKEGELIQP